MGLDTSSLTEPNIRYFISSTLKECRQFKERNMNYFFNIVMCIMFVGVITGFLMYKYKGKLTHREIMERNRQKQEYIMSKLQQISLERKKEHSEEEDTITNLPTFDRY
jgi:uncharacterized membrane protein YgaE (UPF0421/DUF939 family)